MEEWKDIVGYEGKYQVTATGRIRTLNFKGTGIAQELFPIKNKCGYLTIQLYKDGRYHHYGVHRLVAMAFIPNPYNLPQVNHKDEDKTNNNVDNVDNLEWCTAKYNSNYGTKNQRVNETKRKNKLKREQSR